MPPFETMAAIAIVIFLAIGLHEYAHCKVADAAGDPTPGMYGRVTLNLTKHFELVGTLMIFFTSITGFGIGWGKPAPMDPRKMNNPRWDFFAAVAAGPISNILQAAVWGMLLRFAIASKLAAAGGAGPFFDTLFTYGVIINLSLCFFNLIPLGLLDGHWLVGTFLPDDVRARWYLWNRKMGTPLLIGIVILGQVTKTPILGALIIPPTLFMFKFFTGVPF